MLWTLNEALFTFGFVCMVAGFVIAQFLCVTKDYREVVCGLGFGMGVGGFVLCIMSMGSALSRFM